MKSLFFSLMKRTKNQGDGIVVKAQISVFYVGYRFERFILFAPEMLILSVIFLKIQQFQVREKVANYDFFWG